MARCNPYGWENPNGPNPAGGLLADQPVDQTKRWHCGAPAVVRAVWVCSHENLPPGRDLNVRGEYIRRYPDGHESAEPVDLCEYHYHLLDGRVGGQPVPCPRCVSTQPDHKCRLRLRPVS